MGFWDRLMGKPEKKQRQRGPSRPASERLKAEEARYLAELRRADPDAYRDLMRKRLGLTPPEAKDDLEQLEKQINRLRRMGIIKNPNEIGEGNAGLIKDAIAGLAMLLPMLGGGLAAAPQALPQPAAPVPQPAAPVEAHQSIPQPTVPSPQAADPQEDPMHPISQYLIAQLDGKSPEEAAEWLLKQKHAQARELVAALCSTPDGQLMALLAQIADASQEARGLVNWLRFRETWFTSTVRELRRLSTPSGSLSI